MLNRARIGRDSQLHETSQIYRRRLIEGYLMNLVISEKCQSEVRKVSGRVAQWPKVSH